MNALILLMEINPQISAFNAKSISNGFFIYSLSYLNINFFIIFLFFFNISLFFLYLFLTAIFFKFPTTIFFKFHNIFKFCSKKRTRGENIYIYIYIYFSCLILLVDFNNLTMLESEKTTRRIQEKI